MPNYSTEISEGQVKFTIGFQTFTIDYEPHDDRDFTAEEQLEWLRQQVEYALGQLGDPK